MSFEHGGITLPLGQDSQGIWISGKDSVSFPEDAYACCRSLEDTSWWFLHRNAIIGSIVKRFSPSDSFWDIGGGNGCVSSAIEQLGYPCVLVEPGYVGAVNARQRGLQHVICGTLESLNLPDASISALGLFDVLEHVEDLHLFLKHLRRVVQKKGKIYITVPAHNWLWSDEDIFAGHMSRFSEQSLRTLFSECGFKLLYSSYFFSCFSPLIFAARVIPYRLGMRKKRSSQFLETIQKAHRPRTGCVGWIIKRVLNKERTIMTAGHLSHGASIIAVVLPDNEM